MGFNNTPSSERLHIGFFGCTNVGKSSLVNVITNQDMSIVSDTKGTTTDPVKKTMELLPLGPVVIIDTPGLDDDGEIGKKRIDKAKKILETCDIAVLVSVAVREFNTTEKELIDFFEMKKVPYIIVKNKVDILKDTKIDEENIIYTSTINRRGIDNLKDAIGRLSTKSDNIVNFVGDLVKKNDIIILVTPIDSAAPKGRMILPQQQAIRDIIDFSGIAIVAKNTELSKVLSSLNSSPALVVTDSQVFDEVNKIVPKNIPLTSFSILMSRYKGFFEVAVDGARFIDKLKDNSRILISEGCTHHRQCDDIGTVKLPKWLENYTNKKLNFEWTSGRGFFEDLSRFDLIIHCGGCMLTRNEIKSRIGKAMEQNVPFTNYGIAIAYMNGILERSIKPIQLLKNKE